MTDSQYYQVCSLLLFLSTMQFYYIFNKHLQHITHPKLPPSPPSLPVVGHLHLVWPSLYKSLQNLSTQYGPIFNFRLGFSQCIVVTSASVGTEIFKTHDLSFAEHSRTGFSEKTPFGGSGFFSAPYGDYWRFIKKLCLTEFLSPKQLERSRAVREKDLHVFCKMFSRVLSGKRLMIWVLSL